MDLKLEFSFQKASFFDKCSLLYTDLLKSFHHKLFSNLFHAMLQQLSAASFVLAQNVYNISSYKHTTNTIYDSHNIFICTHHKIFVLGITSSGC